VHFRQTDIDVEMDSFPPARHPSVRPTEIRLLYGRLLARPSAVVKFQRTCPGSDIPSAADESKLGIDSGAITAHM